MGQTDRRTDRQTDRGTLNAPYTFSGGIISTTVSVWSNSLRCATKKNEPRSTYTIADFPYYAKSAGGLAI